MTGGDRPWSPRRIIAVDDDPKLLADLTRLLRGAGYIAHAADNGWSASVQAAAMHQLDLLITNTRIADLGADQVIRQARAAKPGLPVLHIGGPLPSDDPMLADVPTLQEPFAPEELLRRVGDLVRRRA